MRRPTVLLGDDHTIMVEGLRKLLEPGFEIVGSADNGRDLVMSANLTHPDVVVLDIAMPVLNGIEAAHQIRRHLPNTKTIFLTMHTDPVYISGAFQAGAQGYVLKRCAAGELVHAIHEVLRGRTYVTPEVAKQTLLGGLESEKSRADLSTREREVLQLIAEGRSAKEIAAVLKISPRTVAFHKTNIGQKLGLRTTAELTQFAIRHGMAGA